ncbi:MAG: phosphoribosylglycinamide formyltransferase [Porphyromonas sp.]|nr:phosphoribosylglycinamide formyltransferase [Porphyromonas sp.]
MLSRLVIFASGSGSNAENIIRYFRSSQRRSNAEVVAIVSNKKEAYVHQRAKELNIPSYTLSAKELTSDPDVVMALLQSLKATHIILAGYLLLIPEWLLEAYPGKIVNIHPALLPAYGGKGMYGHHVHEAVVAAREKKSGITIHIIDGEYDKGQTLFQAEVELEPTDTPDDVAHKISILEQTHFPRVIDEWIERSDHE